MTDEELMKYFEFDAADLDINRRGALSLKQSDRLVQGDRSSRKLFLIIGIVCAALAILPSLILWFLGRFTSVGLFSLLWIIPSGTFAYFLIRAGLKSTTYTVKKVEGEIEITKSGSYNDPSEVYYELHVGDTRFGIGEKFAGHMKKENGVTYAVYYYWGSDTVETDLIDSHIMSLEKVPAKQEKNYRTIH